MPAGTRAGQRSWEGIDETHDDGEICPGNRAGTGADGLWWRWRGRQRAHRYTATTAATDYPATDDAAPVKPQEPAFDAHLSVTNARAAQAAGLTGQNVRIGIVDSGVQRNAVALNGRVLANLNYIDPARNNLGVDDVVGHGTAVASLAAGAATGSWPGGIAPKAQIVSARIIADKPPTDDGSGRGNAFSGPLGVAQVHQDLISYNVKVMNNSWGGLYWTDLPTTAQVAAEYRPFVINHGGLVVFAAGNDGRSEPSSLAALPSQQGVAGTLPAADLERGWLVATAVDPYAPGTLASYANACGQAARYCLAAPGSAVYPDANGGSYYWNYGTSFAAPLISGAAALVWERFPYFSNDLVRQTLLGTAKDIGAPGVDPVFGYGLLDIGRAINGPGRFDWGMWSPTWILLRPARRGATISSAAAAWSSRAGAPWCWPATTVTPAPPASNAASCRCRTVVWSVPM